MDTTYLLRQDIDGLIVRVLCALLNFGQGAAANGMFHHDKAVVRQPQNLRDIFGGHFKRMGTQHHSRFAVLLEGNAIVHTAR